MPIGRSRCRRHVFWDYESDEREDEEVRVFSEGSDISPFVHWLENERCLGALKFPSRFIQPSSCVTTCGTLGSVCSGELANLLGRSSSSGTVGTSLTCSTYLAWLCDQELLLRIPLNV